MIRADVYLTLSGHTSSRKKAQDLIVAQAVKIDGVTVKKSSLPVDETAEHTVEIEQVFKYVSRGGMKLEGALNAFKINVNGCRAIDIGASTGGFTDCLIKRGAAHVTAIDAGFGQLHESLRENPKVRSIEHFNARELSLDAVGDPFDVAVMDVSFISQTYIVDKIADVLKDGGIFVSLIKPQFEAGPQGIGKNGIVVNAAYRFLAVKRVINFAVENGFDCIGLIPSPITGGDGNKEYLAYFVKKKTLNSMITDKMILGITKK